jgi:hypothetical protein
VEGRQNWFIPASHVIEGTLYVRLSYSNRCLETAPATYSRMTPLWMLHHVSRLPGYQHLAYLASPSNQSINEALFGANKQTPFSPKRGIPREPLGKLPGQGTRRKGPFASTPAMRVRLLVKLLHTALSCANNCGPLLGFGKIW